MLQRKIKAVSFTILISLAITISAMSKTIKVPGDYPLIQQAIDASVNGDTVLVDPGTYTENIDFKGKAVILRSPRGPYSTVIDGNQAGSVVTCQSGEDENSILDGFTITNGSGTKYFGRGYGGGMYNYSSSPTVTNCIFSENKVDSYGIGSYGGGISNDYAGNPTVTNCTFIGNEAMEGGGIYNASIMTVANCTFIGNESYSGGGMYNDYASSYNATVTNCTFFGNFANYSGGGMCNLGHNPTVTDCIFTGNEASWGGGIYNNHAIYNPPVTNCTFSRNFASGQGGGICNRYSNPIVTNCTFYGNSAIGHPIGVGGGGMNSHYNSNPTVTNCTFIGNKSAYCGGGMFISYSKKTVTNTIFWNNDAPEGPEIWLGYAGYPASLSISHSDLEGGQASVFVDAGCTLDWGPGMIDSDPLFVDRTEGDFHLTYQSPCRDSGDNGAAGLPSEDFEGDPRIAYGTADMGADEFHRHLYYTGEATPGLAVDVNIVGRPFNETLLCIGTDVLDPPKMTKYGTWYLARPMIAVPTGKIPWTGVLTLRSRISPSYPAPSSIPLQAFVSENLTNLSILEVR